VFLALPRELGESTILEVLDDLAFCFLAAINESDTAAA
jgi:hypothetical protein